MKKRIILGGTVCLFVLATMFSFNISQKANISDLSLKSISVMAQANAEVDPLCPNGCLDNGQGCYCHIWYPCLLEAS